jgi:hypothetical protein
MQDKVDHFLHHVPINNLVDCQVRLDWINVKLGRSFFALHKSNMEF